MKPVVFYTAAILLLPLMLVPEGCSERRREKTISVSGAFALYPLTVRWAEEYQKLHPDITVDISAGGAGKGITDVLSGMVDIAMLSRNINTVETSKGAYIVAVARDAVVPTANASNPLAAEIARRGINKQQFKELFVSNRITSWNQLYPKTANTEIDVYTRSDACGAAEIWAKYLDSDQESLNGTGVFGDPGIADAVRNDAAAIGFNNIIYVYDTKSRKPYEGLAVIPLDQNSNGVIDPEEDFYGTLHDLMKAIYDGRFPSPPARELYLVTKGKPKSKKVKDFLTWIMTDGQQFVNEAGYVKLNDSLVNQQLKHLK